MEILLVYLLQLTLSVSLVGYGCMIAKFLKFKLRLLPVLIVPSTLLMLGIIVITTISSSLNFFYPISPVMSSIIIIVGLIIATFHYKHLSRFIKPFIFILPTFIAFFYGLSLAWGLQLGDTWGYHILAVKWIVEEPTPLGLANLSPRLGYTSLIFSTYAITDFLLIYLNRPLFTFFPIVIGFLCSSITLTLKRLKKHYSPENLLLIGMIVPLSLYTRSIGSLSPDLAALLYILFAFYFFLLFMKNKNYTQLSILILFSAFAFTIKLSALFTLLLIPISLWHMNSKSISKLTPLLLAFFIIGIFIFKSYMISGFPAFPNPSLSISVPWKVPIEKAIMESKFIKNFAKDYSNWQNKDIVNSFRWLPRWILQFCIYERAFLVFLFLCFFYCTLFRSLKNTKSVLYPILTTAILGVSFCFYNAPSARFAHGFLYIIPMSIFALLLPQTQNLELNFTNLKKIKLSLPLLFALSTISFILFILDNYFLGNEFHKLILKLFPSTQTRSLPIVYLAFTTFLLFISISSLYLKIKLKNKNSIRFPSIYFYIFVLAITITTHLGLELPAIFAKHQRLYFSKTNFSINSQNGITTYHAPWPFNETRFSTCRPNKNLYVKKLKNRTIFIDP